MATLQNLGVLKYRDKDGNWKPLPVVLQSSGGGGSGGISTISGKGQPNESTVGRLNQLYRDESTDKLYICTGDDGGYTWAAVVSDTEDAVTYTAQTLTNAQKAQARSNIGAGTSNFSGSYNDLTDKPNIPAASVIDTTLSKAGQAADAKAVGDALANKADKTEIPNVPSWALADAKPTYTASEVGALPNTTVIPDVSGKLDKAQGAENAGKILGVGANGIVTPVDKSVYTLPFATPTVLGGVKPVAKTTAMTQDVGVSEDGKLYTAPSSGGGTPSAVYIPSPATAQVGQIVKVKAVDESGKITETETVDMPSGGGDTSLGITSATVGQIAKIAAVDANGQPTAWEAVEISDGDGGGLRNIDLIVDHTITSEETSVMQLTWDTKTIPELGKYNLFYCVFSSQTKFGFNKWVKFYINGNAVAQFSGINSPNVNKLNISVHRYLGRWVGTSAYNPINSSVFPLIPGECEMNLNEHGNQTNNDAASIGIGSYIADFGLIEGMNIKVYAMV